MERKYRMIVHGDDNDKKYGIPELKKYPMPDAKHVRSAIKFFNYVEPKYEKELANAILNRMQEYGMSFDNFTVGEDNRFSKYMPKDDELAHHGVIGMKWGQRNGPPYPLQRFQKAASEAIIKGKRAMGEAYAHEKAKYKAKQEVIAKRRKEEKEDLDKRRADLARRNRLQRMGYKLLTKQELDELTNRKRSEDNYIEAFKKKDNNKKSAVKDVKDSFIKDVAGTALVETGKAAVIAMLTDKDFRTVATSRIDKAWKLKENNNDNNNNNNNNDNKNKNKGNNGAHTFTINMFNTSWDNASKKDNKNK